jgi:microcystin degradation protein MlrC
MKCGSNWSVAFGDIAAAHFYIDTPGVTSSDVTTLPYTRLDSRYFPLDRNVSWPVESSGGR